ncbi:MAG TPA: HAD-IG family 5'-nucleotidase [Holophagaceae bacterium]|jgi:5'-nucleotidase|nr:HAD-IG family 5'-nucleotidase [Holophagaceae bacterium]
MTLPALPARRASDEGAEDRLPPSKKVFALRNLPLGEIRAIGFDMDYTLARYRSPEIDELAYRKAIRLLVRERAYPLWLLEAPYDPDFAVRGLVLDGARGNLLKVDRERQVVRASHGARPLEPEEMDGIYGRRRLDAAAKGFRSIDTIFEIPECALFALLVDASDGKRITGKSATDIFQDVRWAIDTTHRNGEMKTEILAHRDFFIPKDPQLAPALERLKRGGKKLFLLTNSEWSFTNGVLSHLLNGEDQAYPEWTDLFDLIVVSARKPLFYLEGTPLVAAGADAPAHAFSGGNAAWLEERIGASGQSILYVGDHIYGDIMKSAKTSSWRTLLLIPELERELGLLESKGPQLRRLVQLETLRRRSQRHLSILEDQLQRNHHHRQLLATRLSPDALDALNQEAGSLSRESAELSRRVADQSAEMAGLLHEVESAYNPHWGPMFREGDAQTRFADQIQQYAWAYTGAISNLYAYDPNGTLFAPSPALPHEQV